MFTKPTIVIVKQDESDKTSQRMSRISQCTTNTNIIDFSTPVDTVRCRQHYLIKREWSREIDDKPYSPEIPNDSEVQDTAIDVGTCQLVATGCLCLGTQSSPAALHQWPGCLTRKYSTTDKGKTNNPSTLPISQGHWRTRLLHLELASQRRMENITSPGMMVVSISTDRK